MILSAPSRYLLICFCLLIFIGCQKTYHGEGEVVSTKRQVGNFDKLVLNMSAHVIVTDTINDYCIVSAQGNIQEAIITRLDGNTLVITTKGSVITKKPIEILIGMNQAASFEINGSGTIKSANTMKNEHVDLEVNGSGVLDMDIVAVEVTGGVSGSGHIRLAGSANELKFEINGSGEFDGRQFSTLRSKVKISGSGLANLQVDESLEAHVSGSGIVNYSGNAMVDKKISGSGDVVKMD